MSQVQPSESENQTLIAKPDQTCKIVGYSICGAIVLAIILCIVFIPNPSSSVCGNSEIANSFVLHEKPLSVSSFRHNVEVMVEDENGNTHKVGEYYRKLLAEDRTFRYADDHDHIAASMQRESRDTGAEYVITFSEKCHKNDTYRLFEETTKNNQTFETMFKLSYSSHPDLEGSTLARSPRQAISENAVQLLSGNKVLVSIIRAESAGWEVTVAEDSNIPAFVAGFFALAVTDTAQYADVDMTASPSASPSLTPTISVSASPSPSNSASAASPVAVLVMLMALVVRMW
jgi:hypothetical protein